jgi:hypothetical protein
MESRMLRPLLSLSLFALACDGQVLADADGTGPTDAVVWTSPLNSQSAGPARPLLSTVIFGGDNEQASVETDDPLTLQTFWNDRRLIWLVTNDDADIAELWSIGDPTVTPFDPADFPNRIRVVFKDGSDADIGDVFNRVQFTDLDPAP